MDHTSECELKLRLAFNFNLPIMCLGSIKMQCPLNGQPCDNEKHIQLDGIKVCNNCAIDLTVVDFFKNVLGFAPINLTHTTDVNVVCAGCNLDIPGIRKLGKMGCPQCYESFKQYLIPVLKRSHEGKIKHVGKIPKRNFQHQNIKDLKAKLDEAITAEKYEDACIIRDAIKRLEEHFLCQPNQTPKKLDS